VNTGNLESLQLEIFSKCLNMSIRETLILFPQLILWREGKSFLHSDTCLNLLKGKSHEERHQFGGLLESSWL